MLLLFPLPALLLPPHLHDGHAARGVDLQQPLGLGIKVHEGGAAAGGVGKGASGAPGRRSSAPSQSRPEQASLLLPLLHPRQSPLGPPVWHALLFKREQRAVAEGAAGGHAGGRLGVRKCCGFLHGALRSVQASWPACWRRRCLPPPPAAAAAACRHRRRRRPAAPHQSPSLPSGACLTAMSNLAGPAMARTALLAAVSGRDTEVRAAVAARCIGANWDVISAPAGLAEWLQGLHGRPGWLRGRKRAIGSSLGLLGARCTAAQPSTAARAPREPPGATPTRLRACSHAPRPSGSREHSPGRTGRRRRRRRRTGGLSSRKRAGAGLGSRR